jgi:hypothetical protein
MRKQMRLEDVLNVNLEDDDLDEGILYEAGLSRVLSHTSKPFAVITAFRDDYSLSQNRGRNSQLESVLKQLRAGGIKLIGFWQEAPDDMSYAQAKKEGKLTPVKEESYFIPMPQHLDWERFYETMKKVGKKFNQDAILLGDGKSAWLEYKGGKKESVGSIGFNKMNQAYSKLRRGNQIPFVFEGTMQPSGIMHRMALQKRGVRWFSENQ